MFENTLALYEWYRSRVAQVERRLGRCAGMVVDTGYKEGLETQRTRAVQRLQTMEDAIARDLRAARPPLEDTTDDFPDAGSEPVHGPPPASIPTRLKSWLRLRVR